jgi:hypothetical protein
MDLHAQLHPGVLVFQHLTHLADDFTVHPVEAILEVPGLIGEPVVDRFGLLREAIVDRLGLIGEAIVDRLGLIREAVVDCPGLVGEAIVDRFAVRVEPDLDSPEDFVNGRAQLRTHDDDALIVP